MLKSLKKVKEIYKSDLELHSNIKPLEDVINYEFEKEVEKSIVEYLRKKAKYKGCNTLYAGFINRNFDTVLLEEMNDDMLILTSINMSTKEVKTTCLKREIDNKNPFINYTKTRISNLPDWLKSIIQERNTETYMYSIFTYRLVMSLCYDIKNLVIHHIEYFKDENNSNKKNVNDSIEYLLPVTKSFHNKIIHNIDYDLLTDKDKQNLIQKGYELKKVFNEFVEPKKNWNAPSIDCIKRVLTKHLKENVSIKALSDDYNNPSKNTIIKIPIKPNSSDIIENIKSVCGSGR